MVYWENIGPDAGKVCCRLVGGNRRTLRSVILPPFVKGLGRIVSRFLPESGQRVDDARRILNGRWKAGEAGRCLMSGLGEQPWCCVEK